MIYRNSKGKFISKEEWLSLQPKENKGMNDNNKRGNRRTPKLANPLQEEQLNQKFVETINNIEDRLNSLNKGKEIAEGTQVTPLGSDFDLDEYKRKVEEFEKSMEEEEVEDTISEEEVEPTKTPGFFTTWFKKWF